MDEAQSRQFRFLMTVAGYALLAVATLWFFYLVREILPPLFAAFILTIVLVPVVDRLQKGGLPRWIATLIVYLLLIGVIIGLLFVLVPLVSSQIGDIVTSLRVRFHLDEPTDLTSKVADEIKIFGRRNAVPAFLIQPAVQQAKNSAALLTRGLESFGNLLLGVIPNLIYVVIVPIVAYYALIDYHQIFAKMLMLFPSHNRNDVQSLASDVAAVFGKYLRGLGIVSMLSGLITTGTLLFFDTTRPYAAALGLIAGLLYAVPYLGAFLSTSLIALLAFVSPGGSLVATFWILLPLLFLRHIMLDQLISPRILGGGVGLHPILSIAALMAGNALFGVGGTLLAVPIAASAQVLIVHIVPRLARRVRGLPMNVTVSDGEPEAEEEVVREEWDTQKEWKDEEEQSLVPAESVPS